MAIKASASISLTRVNDADSIDIGGRNLVLKSNIKHENDSYLIHKYETSETIKEGTEVVVQIKGTLGKDKTHFSLYSYNGSCRVVDLVKPDADGIYRAKVKWQYKTWNGSDCSPVPEVNVYAAPDSIKTNSSIEWIKIEKGNRPSDWSPAPEDIQNDIGDAVNNSKVEITNEYNSAIDQTSKQLQLLVQNVETITKGNSSTITELSNQLQITSETAQFVKITAEKLQNAIDEKLSSEEIREWARFDGATLELGASNSQFKCKLSNTELAFFQGENKVAWVSNNELHILTAIITKSIGCGNFTFVDEGDNGFSLI